MTDSGQYPPLRSVPPPGLARRRMLRAAGINLHISDFTDEEQDERGFHGTGVHA